MRLLAHICASEELKDPSALEEPLPLMVVIKSVTEREKGRKHDDGNLVLRSSHLNLSVILLDYTQHFLP